MAQFPTLLGHADKAPRITTLAEMNNATTVPSGLVTRLTLLYLKARCEGDNEAAPRLKADVQTCNITRGAYLLLRPEAYYNAETALMVISTASASGRLEATAQCSRASGGCIELKNRKSAEFCSSKSLKQKMLDVFPTLWKFQVS